LSSFISTLLFIVKRAFSATIFVWVTHYTSRVVNRSKNERLTGSRGFLIVDPGMIVAPTIPGKYFNFFKDFS
jgi:hypothetical protein